MLKLSIILGLVTWNPPPEFDHPYSGTLSIERLPQRQVVLECIKLTGLYSATMLGCAWVKDGHCEVITIDRTTRGATPRAVLRHEIGHCNGWSHGKT